MTALVTDNLPLVAGAPNGISKLRELIRDLAVRGKLVDAAERSQPCGKAGGHVVTAGWPFDIPSHWLWCRLAELEPIFQNGASSRGESEGVPVIVIRLADIKDGEISLDDSRTLTLSASTVQKYELAAGDILVIRVNGSADLVGRFVVCRSPLAAIPCDHFIRARFRDGSVNSSYMKIVGDCRATRAAVSDLFVSTAGQKTVNQGHLGSIAIPMPPLEEQHRIVAKVDELMALCDQLEAQQADAEAAHAQLVKALLASLTQARDPADFRASWQQLSAHFHTLFTTEASIDALKNTVLQLGTSGKLVPQEFTQTTLDDLPPGWDLLRIDEFCTVQGGIQKTQLRRPVLQHFPYLRVANVQRNRIDCSEMERYELTLDELARWRMSPGDLLIVEGNGSANEIGRCAIWNGEVEDCVYQNHLIRVRLHDPKQINYLALYLNSPMGTAHMRRLAITTSGLFNLSVGKIRSIPIALPPLAEQHRIVAKVDELLALCDQLKLGLADARQHHAHLAGVLVEQAVAT